jgi:serine/threonine protein kinase
MSSASPQRVPPRVGKYRIIRHLKSGAMASVYKAEDTESGLVVALKVLTPESLNQPKRLERFRREGLQGARLRHENIVAVYDFGEADGSVYLALEFVEGVDVEELIREQGPLMPEDARSIVVQVAQALDYAHRMEMVHRDIKPSNILITRQHGRCIAKLADLGLARGGLEDETRMTADGSTVGTVDYMPPEQARNSGSADTRSDMYSLGCTLYQMLSGDPPFAEGSIVERLMKHTRAEPTDLRAINPDVPEALWAICRRMLAKQPSQRYQTPTELLADLAHAAPTAESLAAERPTKIKLEPSEDTKIIKSGAKPKEQSGASASLADRLTRHETEKANTEKTDSTDSGPRRVVERQFQHGVHAIANGNYDYGMMLLLNCCQAEPGNVTFHQALYDAQRGRSAAGMRPWRSLPVRVYLKLGVLVARHLHRPLRVLAYGRQLLACNPHDLTTRLAMAEAAHSAGHADLAIWLLQTVLADHSDHDHARRTLADLLEQHGDIPQALSMWETIAAANPLDGAASRKVRNLSANVATGKYYADRKAKRSSRGNSLMT